MEAPADASRFLSSSENRVTVLAALSPQPTPRREIQDETGVSQSTLSRILDECEDRGWVSSTGSRYRITPIGEAVIEEFRAHVERIEGIYHLDEAVGWLPPAARSIDYRHLRDARITTPSVEEPTAHLDRGLAVLRSANRFRILAEAALPRYVRAIHEEVRDRGLGFEAVVSSRSVDSLREAADGGQVWPDSVDSTLVYDGPIPIGLHIADGTVLVWLVDVDGDQMNLRGLLESDDDHVLEWAEDLYDSYREDAEPLDEDRLQDV